LGALSGEGPGGGSWVTHTHANPNYNGGGLPSRTGCVCLAGSRFASRNATGKAGGMTARYNRSNGRPNGTVLTVPNLSVRESTKMYFVHDTSRSSTPHIREKRFLAWITKS